MGGRLRRLKRYHSNRFRMNLAKTSGIILDSVRPSAHLLVSATPCKYSFFMEVF